MKISKKRLRQIIMEEMNYIEQMCELEETVSKEGDKYVVRSKAGKRLGSHDTKKEANEQLGAIEANKKRGQ